MCVCMHLYQAGDFFSMSKDRDSSMCIAGLINLFIHKTDVQVCCAVAVCHVSVCGVCLCAWV